MGTLGHRHARKTPANPASVIGSVTKPPVVLCAHGRDLDLCATAPCPEIRRLWNESAKADSADGLLVIAPGQQSLHQQKSSSKADPSERWPTKSFERKQIRLDQSDPQLDDRHQRKRRRWSRQSEREELSRILPNPADVASLERAGLISRRQGAMLGRLLAAPLDRPWTRICDEVGARFGCSRRTVSRELTQAIHAACTRYYVSRTQGEEWIPRAKGDWRRVRSPREVWQRVRDRGRNGAELVTDPAVRRRVLQRATRTDQVLTPIDDGPMSLLLAALVSTLSKGVALLPPDASITESPDWPFNQQWARRRVRRRRQVGEIYGALVRGCRLCAHCHTPILAGCRLDGQVIRADRACCCTACRQAHWRIAYTSPSA